jgi:selT/selW/selH-like putative selenoprotein
VAAINDRTDNRAKATPGETGQFDILVDDRLVFSKWQEGRFPEEEEALRLVDVG